MRIEAGDTAGIAVSQMNLGVMLQRLGRLDEARARQEESLRLRREIGDPRMIALAEHNLGILTRVQGEYDETKELFAGALRVQRDQNDRWALAFMLEDVAVLAALLGEPELALRLAGAGVGPARGDPLTARGRDAGGARRAARARAGGAGRTGRDGVGGRAAGCRSTTRFARRSRSASTIGRSHCFCSARALGSGLHVSGRGLRNRGSLGRWSIVAALVFLVLGIERRD